MKVRHQDAIAFFFVVLLVGAACSFFFYFVVGLFFDQYLSKYISGITGKEISIALGYSFASAFMYSDKIKELFKLMRIKDD